MKLTDMSMSKKERKDSEPKVSGSTDGPKYPYGLSLTLSNDSLKKLGLGLPKVGSYVNVTARCCVVAVRSSEREDYEDRSVELQIERMSVDKGGPKSMEDAIDEGIKNA